VRFTSTGVSDSGQGKLHVEGRLEATGKVVPEAFDAVVHRVDRGLQMDVTARSTSSSSAGAALSSG
jgi:polyisoprenoid-binding protein YceI